MRLTALTTRLSELFNELNRMPKRQDEFGRVGHEGALIIASALYLMPTAVDATPANIRAYAAKSKQDLDRFAQILGEQDRAVRIVREMIAVCMGEQPVPAHTEVAGMLFCSSCGRPKTTCIECPHCAANAMASHRAKGGESTIVWATPVRQTLIGAAALLAVFAAFLFFSSTAMQIVCWLALIVPLLLLMRALNTWCVVYDRDSAMSDSRNESPTAFFQLVMAIVLLVGISVATWFVSRVPADWRLNSVLAENTEERYLAYLPTCPDRQRITVQDALIKMRWENACKADTIRAYQGFLDGKAVSPPSHLREQAEKRLTAKGQELAQSFKPILDGNGVPAAQEAGRGPRKLLLLDSTGQLHPWQGLLPKTWQPDSTSDVTEVAVIGPAGEMVLEVCQYIGGPPITRYSCTLNVRVHAARSGQLKEEKLHQNIARPCMANEQVSLTRLGDPVTFYAVKTWLGSLIEGQHPNPQ